MDSKALRVIRKFGPMKIKIFLSAILLFSVMSLVAQRKTMLVKFSGDTLYFDDVTCSGKNMVCKNKGEDKVKIPATEVSFYVEPRTIWIVKKGEKSVEHDTTRKCFMPADSKIHTVQMENENYYLTSITKTIDGREFNDFYIMTKKNEQVMEIKEDITALDALIKYFGGTCSEFDLKVAGAKPKFDKRVFPIQEWWQLIYFYNDNCRK